MRYLLPFFLVLCFNASAQDVSGLYSGILVNDSTKKVQNYELALSEYKGKITGYAYTTFVVNDTFYYSVKRIKATKENGALIVEDVKMVANNFPSERSKGVYQINTIPLPQQDSIKELKGTWRTNQTKVYYSINGGLDLKKDNDSLRSALINHLYELDVLQRPAAPVYVNNKEKETEKTKPATGSVAKTEVKAPKKESKPTKADDKSLMSKSKDVAPAAIPVESRTTKVMQTIDVVTDSLVLSFYDNGIVDGDTISVNFNGQNIISKTKLTAVAAKKSVLLRSTDSDMYQLTLIAENLGTIPPNTGLLIVQDGQNKYNVHFSADLQNNAAIVFRKKK
ncbi:hypothetical protein OCK74_17630 [Chitinophagaceae bacterium LB-8]|uniref:DUF4138 domain-containing protein n=1 Tax=Paraflavisolibacter caeni TaxID=2982496 RepID=A0A9X2XX71_9BACT|nr:hypothetical protein [Paraflavisolibacter caeni]MCU7550946.1 hypothetical protein [Paraflavisolibacter caeni]